MYPLGGEVDQQLRARQIKLETEADDSASQSAINKDPFAEQLKEFKDEKEVSKEQGHKDSEEFALPYSKEDCEEER